ncbi:aldehyde dehydrogenase family protein [Rhodococcus pyridinivorans]|uniref:aldehyde dehydrogenase family protein n=1 Tax=Rhodococcus pyridinivorans TaxID=103816 RepID=UPI002078F929|nr:aldehyde dehydrogenase family protein [Rhodococcus pyridinivorans]
MRVAEGEQVVLEFTDSTTRRHPMHLHGHTYQHPAAAPHGPRPSCSDKNLRAELDADNSGRRLVLHVLPGDGDIGAAIVTHPDIPCIWFTGSTAAGREIGEASGSLLKKVHLELGGNNALPMMPDVDVQAAASMGAWDSFLHQGQIRMATGRHLVHSSIAEEYIAALVDR